MQHHHTLLALPATATPQEVDDTRYVTPTELADMMRPESGLKWHVSPCAALLLHTLHTRTRARHVEYRSNSPF